MKRTTLSLRDALDQELRSLAAKEKKPLGALINDFLQQSIVHYKKEKKSKKKFHWNSIKTKEMPSFDPADRSTYLDKIERY